MEFSPVVYRLLLIYCPTLLMMIMTPSMTTPLTKIPLQSSNEESLPCMIEYDLSTRGVY